MKTTIAAVAAALTLAGCSASDEGGGDTGPADAGTAKDACSLLTDEQVTEVLDVAPTSHAEDKTVPTAKFCQWETDENGVAVSVAYGTTADYPWAPDTPGNDGWEEVSGVGEKAAYQTGVLVVSAGGYNMQILCSPAYRDNGGTTVDEERSKDASVETAGYALDALGVGGS